MSTPLPAAGLQLRSLLRASGELELSLAEVPVVAPGAGEVLVRVEAAPINPSDLGLLIGPVDMAAARTGGSAARPTLTAPVAQRFMTALAARVDQSLPVGNEGAGTVIAAGEGAGHLLGRMVAMFGGAMYAQYRTLKLSDCLVLGEGATAAQGASCFVNPLTALGMVETMRREGHTALVHTAAASNLGQMLVRICQANGIALVNIVRSAEQAALLRGQGAVHVLDSSAADFTDRLTDALAETGATLGFDATGGGRLAGQILSAMEAAINRRATTYSRYGSAVHKQVYIYGSLDTRPTEFTRSFGSAWGLGGWLLMPRLAQFGAETAARMKARVAAELTTTFASHYSASVGLAEALRPEAIAAYSRRATRAKYLIEPQRG
jgi:NADPH2:quinone reductase